METKNIKEFMQFLKCGWWVVGWIFFVGFSNFWCFITLGIFGVGKVFQNTFSALFLGDMFLSIVSSLLLLDLLFIIIKGEDDNPN